MTGCNRELASWTYTVPGRVVCARNGNRGWQTRKTGCRRSLRFGRHRTVVTRIVDRSSAADFDRNLFRHPAIHRHHLRRPSVACWKSVASWTEQWSAHLKPHVCRTSVINIIDWYNLILWRCYNIISPRLIVIISAKYYLFPISYRWFLVLGLYISYPRFIHQACSLLTPFSSSIMQEYNFGIFKHT